jgi:transcriptional regulator with XRE-family HTH domain
MPNMNADARKWEESMTARFGEAVRRRRKQLGMTAVDLSKKLGEQGYPMKRVMITVIETNSRNGKLDVAELLALARALEIPPVLLLFPDFPDAEVEFLPGMTTDCERAVRWLAGEQPLPAQIIEGEGIVGYPRNPGIDLIAAADERSRYVHDSLRAGVLGPRADDDDPAAKKLLDTYRQLVAEYNQRIIQAHAALWGDDGGG